MILGSSPTNACTQVQVCELNSSAVMLAANRSAGVAWVVNLRNPLHTGDEEYKQWSHHSFKTQGRGHQKSKTGVSVAHKKDLCPPKIKKHIFGNIEAQLFSYSKNGLVNNLAAGLIGSDDWFRELLPSWKTATCKLTSNPSQIMTVGDCPYWTLSSTYLMLDTSACMCLKYFTITLTSFYK